MDVGPPNAKRQKPDPFQGPSVSSEAMHSEGEEPTCGPEHVHNLSGGSDPPSGKPHKKLGTSNFAALLGNDESYYVDKTGLIEAFFASARSRVLLTAPRRFGKTINLAMFRHFFELQRDLEELKLSEEEFQEKVKQTENYILFDKYKLNITKNDDLMKKHFGRYPVISISFKCEHAIESYGQAMTFCKRVISKAFEKRAYLESSLNDRDRAIYNKWCNNEWDVNNEEDHEIILDGLKTLAEYMYKHFGRGIVLLVDEYDCVITKGMLGVKNIEDLERIINNCISLIRTAVKEDEMENWIEYAFITGISHISSAGLSGSNVKPFKFLRTHHFVPYYGLTAKEVEQLLKETYGFNREKIEYAEKKFNGYISKNGIKIYNMWSLLEYAGKVTEGEDEYEWPDTGMITGLKAAFRFPKIKELIETKLLNGQPIIVGEMKPTMDVEDVLELIKVIGTVDPRNVLYPNTDLFFSFILEQGYLSCVPEENKLLKSDENMKLMLPNEQMKAAVKKKLRDFHIAVFADYQKLTDECRQFIRQLSETTCDNDAFKNFYENLAQLFQLYSATWSVKNEENMRCTIGILVNNLGFTVCAEAGFKFKGADGQDQQRYVDYVLTKGNFALIVELKYKGTNESAMLCIRDKGYYKVLEARNVIERPVTHFVLMGINMDENGKVSIGYLQDSQDFDDVTYLP